MLQKHPRDVSKTTKMHFMTAWILPQKAAIIKICPPLITFFLTQKAPPIARAASFVSGRREDYIKFIFYFISRSLLA